MRVLGVLDPTTKKARVWLDGVEVSRDCYRAEVTDAPGVEATGTVYLYSRRDGRHYLDPATQDTAKETRTVRVRWELP